MAQLTLKEVLFPSRDVSFAQIIRQLSAPESGPAADNLISNEDAFPRICGEIQERVPKEGVYLGVGPDQNLTYIAHCRPCIAFILDHRRRNLLLHLVHKALFALSADRVSYLARLTARSPHSLKPDASADNLFAAFESLPMDKARLKETIADVIKVLQPLDMIQESEWPALATIQAKLAGPGMHARFLALPIYPTFGSFIRATDRQGRPAHFLSSENLYNCVRDTEVGDRVLPFTGDFADSVAIPRLARWLHERRLMISLFYISDVEFFLLRAGRFNMYVDNLVKLPWSPNAHIARTSTREIHSSARLTGDHSTTILQPIAQFLDAAQAGRIRTADDLFPA